jgi:hypothetical protein
MSNRTLSATQRAFNFLVHLMTGLATYTYLTKKPSIDIYPKDLPALSFAVF